MKKLFALMLALMLALSGMSALASTVCTKVAVDRDVAAEVLSGFGVTEDQMSPVDTAIAVVNALSVNVIAVDDGAQIDLDLNGENALSLGIAADDQGIAIASTLFPGYIVTMTGETLTGLLEQLAANLPGAGSGEGSVDMNAMAEVFGGYFTRWFEACAAAGQPGEPVTGQYEFEGYTFDTMVSVTVDMAAITQATRSLMDELLADPAAMAMLKGMAQGMVQSSGETFDESTFEADFKAGFEEWIAHFPVTADAQFYANSDGSETFYLYGESVREGETDPFVAYMFYVDQTNMQMGYQDGQSTAGAFAMDGTDMSMSFTMGEMYFGLAMSFPENQFAFDIYFMNADKPLICVDVTVTDGGERTLSMDAAGKTTLAVEDVMADQSGQAAQGIVADIMTNGLSPLLGVLSQQVPEIAGLLSAYTAA